MRHTLLGLVAMTATLAAGACEPLEPAYRLERPRLLGAKLVVTAEPTRANLRAGDAVVLETYTGSLTKDRGAFASAAFTVCAAADDPIEARCVGPRFADTSTRGPEDPRVAFTVPPGSAGKMLVFAMFCVEGEAAIAASELRGACDRGAGQEMVVRFEVGGAPNTHPVLDSDAIALDGVPIVESRGCGEGARVVRADGISHDLTIAVAGAEDGEEILVSHVVTAGKLEGLYSNAGSDGTFRVGWEPPTPLPEGRVPVRVHVVARDGRGGVAARVVDICLEKGTAP